MRLLHTTNITLSTFYDESIPPYAILSHTWSDGEVSFQDLLQRSPSELNDLEGYSKIRSCCALAAYEGYRYVWIDTCCIDKTSSAELSEAVNSMYRWYQDAQVCYAYLADVRIIDKGPWCPDGGQEFRESRWFTRGWTLQELLAPESVIFYGCDWQEFGSKSSLKAQISLITGIQQAHMFDINGASAAQKMSWAARRKTTRLEDMAYSLMGIFDVNMPLLYGEGKKAFARLQHEIVRISDDESIFAWTDNDLVESGIFSQSPKAFADSGDVVRIIESHRLYIRRAPYAVTNRGFAIEIFARKEDPATIMSNWGTSFVPLNCQRLSKSGLPSDQRLVIELDNLSLDNFVRSSPGNLFPPMWSIDRLSPKLVYVRPSYVSYNADGKQNRFFICDSSLSRGKVSICDTYNCECHREWQWDQEYHKITIGRRQSFVAVLLIRTCYGSRAMFGLVLRKVTYTLSIDIVVPSKDQSFRETMDEYKYSGTDCLPSLGACPVSAKLQDNRWVSAVLKMKRVGAGERQGFVEFDEPQSENKNPFLPHADSLSSSTGLDSQVH